MQPTRQFWGIFWTLAVVLAGLFAWFLGNLLYTLFWKQLGDWGVTITEAQMIAYICAHLIPFVLALLVTGILAFLIRGQLADAGSHTPARVLATERDSKEKRQKLREALGSFMLQGQQLQMRCADETREAPEAEADAWANNVEIFLRVNLDSGHIARFRDDSDIPMGVTSIYSTTHRNLWGGLRVRLARLNQFIAEIPT